LKDESPRWFFGAARLDKDCQKELVTAILKGHFGRLDLTVVSEWDKKPNEGILSIAVLENADDELAQSTDMPWRLVVDVPGILEKGRDSSLLRIECQLRFEGKGPQQAKCQNSVQGSWSE
jgi:hypothetical protein